MRVLDEIFLRHATTQAACEEFLKRYPAHRAGVVIYGDASGFHEQTTGSSDYRMVQEYFRANSEYEGGLSRCRRRIRAFGSGSTW